MVLIRDNTNNFMNFALLQFSISLKLGRGLPHLNEQFTNSRLEANLFFQSKYLIFLKRSKTWATVLAETQRWNVWCWKYTNNFVLCQYQQPTGIGFSVGAGMPLFWPWPGSGRSGISAGPSRDYWKTTTIMCFKIIRKFTCLNCAHFYW